MAQDLAEAALGAPGVAKAEAAAGFLNVWLDQAALAAEVLGWARSSPGALGRGDRLAGQRVVIEYSSPNTNKPQHLGHCRNNLLGQAVSTLMGAAGAEVTRVNLINDRGIHICKSMLAWQRFGDGATPASTGKKGDHLIGDFYVKFDEALRAEYAAAPRPLPHHPARAGRQPAAGGRRRRGHARQPDQRPRHPHLQE
ncbi:MAG: arginine--tRNA ligase, partial [bacterium]